MRDSGAGQLSQAGFILALLLRSLVACGRYDESDFCRRLDAELLPLLDGTPMSGPWWLYQSVDAGGLAAASGARPWGQTGGHVDTTEAVERTLALAVRYALNLQQLAHHHPEHLADAG